MSRGPVPSTFAIGRKPFSMMHSFTPTLHRLLPPNPETWVCPDSVDTFTVVQGQGFPDLFFRHS